MKKIVQSPSPVLRRVADVVSPQAIKSPKIISLLADMREALHNEPDGVAIAAPQIGTSVRIFVIAQRVSKTFTDDIVCINPEIVRMGKKREMLSEGCLSVRWKYGLVKRATTATLRAVNAEGNEFVLSGRGLLAQIFQHEMDHLNGVLFIDKASDVQDVPPQHDA